MPYRARPPVRSKRGAVQFDAPERLEAGAAMRPKERRETGQTDLFRARLDQLVDLQHPLAKLARTIDWGFLEERFGAVDRDGPGQPPLATRLMAGLAILSNLAWQKVLQPSISQPWRKRRSAQRIRLS